jgi:hypothetical protein
MESIAFGKTLVNFGDFGIVLDSGSGASFLFVAQPPSPLYGIPPYLISKNLREGLIPFPYLGHTVCILPIPFRTNCAGFPGTEMRMRWIDSAVTKVRLNGRRSWFEYAPKRGINRQTWRKFLRSVFRGLRRYDSEEGLTAIQRVRGGEDGGKPVVERRAIPGPQMRGTWGTRHGDPACLRFLPALVG